ncbi:MAG: hypothetical protein KC592_19410, partial [Nitrospira sp.]|nr:hypothetical protein [Nitrospira sp.]
MIVRTAHRSCRFIGFSIMLILWMGLSDAQATGTKVVVRALAKDAMFIGTSMGGANLIIRDVESGAILAEGRTHGDTGSPVTVIQEPRKRGRPLSDPSTAKVETSLNLLEPTLVSIEARAPASQRQSRIKASTQLWLLPGKDIEGDGVILEIPSFAVNILSPQPAERVQLSSLQSVPITLNVLMMCGCPITPDGLWDANQYEVAGIVKHNGIPVDTVSFIYGGKPNTFQGNLELHDPGSYEIQACAF